MARDFKEFSLASEAPGEPVPFSSLLASPIQLPGNPSPGLMRLAQFGGSSSQQIFIVDSVSCGGLCSLLGARPLRYRAQSGISSLRVRSRL